MLPQFLRLYIYNNTGATIAFGTSGVANSFVVTARPWKYGTDGAVTYGTSEETWFADPTTDLTNAAGRSAASAVDNSTNLWIGTTCVATLSSDATTAGNLEIYMESSTDGGSTYPSDAPDFQPQNDLQLVGIIDATGNLPNRSINFEL